MPANLSTDDADFETAFTALLNAKREDSPDVDATVARIIQDVRDHGDAAVTALTHKFDRVALTADQLRISAADIAQAIAQVSPADRAALELAASRITAYHSKQLPQDHSWIDETGAELGWRWTPWLSTSMPA